MRETIWRNLRDYAVDVDVPVSRDEAEADGGSPGWRWGVHGGRTSDVGLRRYRFGPHDVRTIPSWLDARVTEAARGSLVFVGVQDHSTRGEPSNVELDELECALQRLGPMAPPIVVCLLQTVRKRREALIEMLLHGAVDGEFDRRREARLRRALCRVLLLLARSGSPVATQLPGVVDGVLLMRQHECPKCGGLFIGCCEDDVEEEDDDDHRDA